MRTLPKVELHLHLEGSIRPGTAEILAAKHGLRWEAAASPGFTDFSEFLAEFLAGLELLRGADDFAAVTAALAEELAAQNVRYAEVTTTPYNHHRRGIPMPDYREGLDEGRRLASAEGVEIGWILDIPRELEPPDQEFTADFILGPVAPAGVVGIGLGGPETGWPAHLFAGSFARVKAAGLASLPHAGETDGPESVWSALNDLGADRIGHGIRSRDDGELVDRLASNGTPLEISMTSNLCTGVVPSIEQHPIRELFDAGIPISINTDDPAYFYTTLTDELQAARKIHGFSHDELGAIQLRSIRDSFAPASLRQEFEAELTEWLSAS